MNNDQVRSPWTFAASEDAKRAAENNRLLQSMRDRAQALTLPPIQPTAPDVLDSDAHQFAVEYAKLSVNGKRHAKAMIAGLVRLEQGGV